MATDDMEDKPRVVLSARGLRKDFAGFTAVNNVDLDVHHGKIHALIGPNGAGKTTVFNLLTKFLPPTGGRIELLGRDITRTSAARVARMGLVRSFQISAVFPHLSVLDNVRVALQRPQGLATQFWRSTRKCCCSTSRWPAWAMRMSALFPTSSARWPEPAPC
jgi:branched-chain amino acid transport system ATP-binding protein